MLIELNIIIFTNNTNTVELKANDQTDDVTVIISDI